MKKIILSITVAVCSVVSINAQTTDWDFENWIKIPVDSSGNDYFEEPQGWFSSNFFSLFDSIPGPYMVTQETAAPYKGKVAAKIVSQEVNLFGFVGYMGFLAAGNLFSLDFMAVPFTDRPEKISFAYKYEPNGIDSARSGALLTKWNSATNERDTIASGEWFTTDKVSSWTKQDMNLTYSPQFSQELPDSILLVFSCTNGEKAGSTLYLDDITFSGWVSVNDLDDIKNNVSVFPVPARESITFSSSLNASSVEVLDITGRRVGYYNMISNRVTIETTQLPNGLYIYNVTNSENKVVGRGKFEVAK